MQCVDIRIVNDIILEDVEYFEAILSADNETDVMEPSVAMIFILPDGDCTYAVFWGGGHCVVIAAMEAVYHYYYLFSLQWFMLHWSSHLTLYKGTVVL